MLIKKDVTNKEKSHYICDMCKKEIYNKGKYAIYIAVPKNIPKKKWDLCKRCLNIIAKNIAIWSDRKRGTYD